jgi:hypothetical protein
MAERRDYDALAQDINLDDITSCKRNANILRKIRDGDPDWNKSLYILSEEDEDGCSGDVVVGEEDDLGWLGYFIGKCDVLEELYIWYLPGERDRINRFFDGMSRNRSIQFLEIKCEIGDDNWISLGSFFENSRNLSGFTVEGLIGQESARNLALALGQMNHNRLKLLTMDSTGIGDERFAEIATTLRSQSHLEYLIFDNNNIGRSGCVALGNTLSRLPASNNLKTLHLSGNVIDDVGLQALAEGMMNCHSLTTIYLGGNRSITAAGLSSLSPLLQSESHSLVKVSLFNINFRDDGAIALAEGLRGNKTLKELWLSPETAGITSVGWSAFSRLLCDTSTVNRTYLSNHTLTKICGYGETNEGIPEDIQRLLTTNRNLNRQGAAVYKILRSHPDLDMEPFFKLKMKFLPVVISWLQRARPSRLGTESKKKSASRKISALYKFVRAMPDLAVIGYWEGRMIHIEAKKRRLADEMRKAEYEEDITRERLGMSGQPMDEASASRNKRMRLE